MAQVHRLLLPVILRYGYDQWTMQDKTMDVIKDIHCFVCILYQNHSCSQTRLSSWTWRPGKVWFPDHGRSGSPGNYWSWTASTEIMMERNSPRGQDLISFYEVWWTDTENSSSELKKLVELSEEVYQCITLVKMGQEIPKGPAEYIDNLFKWLARCILMIQIPGYQ